MTSFPIRIVATADLIITTKPSERYFEDALIHPHRPPSIRQGWAKVLGVAQTLQFGRAPPVDRTRYRSFVGNDLFGALVEDSTRSTARRAARKTEIETAFGSVEVLLAVGLWLFVSWAIPQKAFLADESLLEWSVVANGESISRATVYLIAAR